MFSRQNKAVKIAKLIYYKDWLVKSLVHKYFFRAGGKYIFILGPSKSVVILMLQDFFLSLIVTNFCICCFFAIWLFFQVCYLWLFSATFNENYEGKKEMIKTSWLEWMTNVMSNVMCTFLLIELKLVLILTKLLIIIRVENTCHWLSVNGKFELEYPTHGWSKKFKIKLQYRDQTIFEKLVQIAVNFH